MLERLEAGANHGRGGLVRTVKRYSCLSGDLSDRMHGRTVPGPWIRTRRVSGSGSRVRDGATYWVKRGHLRPMS